MPWNFIGFESNLDNAWNSIKDLLMSVADSNTPVVTRRITRELFIPTTSFTGAAIKGCEMLCRLNFVRKKPTVIQSS